MVCAFLLRKVCAFLLRKLLGKATLRLEVSRDPNCFRYIVTKCQLSEAVHLVSICNHDNTASSAWPLQPPPEWYSCYEQGCQYVNVKQTLSHFDLVLIIIVTTCVKSSRQPLTERKQDRAAAPSRRAPGGGHSPATGLRQ